MVRTDAYAGSSISAGQLKLRIKYTAKTFFDWTGGRNLVVRDDKTGTVVYKVDIKPGDPQDGEQEVVLNTGVSMQAGHSYTVTAPLHFARLMAPPWAVNAINKGNWTFSVK